MIRTFFLRNWWHWSSPRWSCLASRCHTSNSGSGSDVRVVLFIVLMTDWTPFASSSFQLDFYALFIYVWHTIIKFLWATIFKRIISIAIILMMCIETGLRARRRTGLYFRSPIGLIAELLRTQLHKSWSGAFRSHHCILVQLCSQRVSFYFIFLQLTSNLSFLLCFRLATGEERRKHQWEKNARGAL